MSDRYDEPASDIFFAEIDSVGTAATDSSGTFVPHGWTEKQFKTDTRGFIDHPRPRDGTTTLNPGFSPNGDTFAVGDIVAMRMRGWLNVSGISGQVYDILFRVGAGSLDCCPGFLGDDGSGCCDVMGGDHDCCGCDCDGGGGGGGSGGGNGEMCFPGACAGMQTFTANGCTWALWPTDPNHVIACDCPTGTAANGPGPGWVRSSASPCHWFRPGGDGPDIQPMPPGGGVPALPFPPIQLPFPPLFPGPALPPIQLPFPPLFPGPAVPPIQLPFPPLFPGPALPINPLLPGPGFGGGARDELADSGILGGGAMGGSEALGGPVLYVPPSQGGWGSSGTLTPSTISANQDNYAPGTGPYALLRISSDGSGVYSITGLNIGQTDGHLLVIENYGATDAINLALENGSSTAAYRFNNGAAAGNDTIATQSIVRYIYSGAISRWRKI